MANKKLSTTYVVKMFGELKMMDHRERFTKKVEHLKLLDGFYESDPMIQYVYDDNLDTAKMSGGIVRCQFDSTKKKLFLVTDFGFADKPTKAQIASLKKECIGQWSDGIGEGAFDNFGEACGFGVETYIPKPLVSESKGKPFAPSTKDKANLKKLAAAWKKTGKENAPKGDKAILEKCFKAIEKKNIKSLKTIVESNNLDLNFVQKNRSSDFDEKTLLVYASHNSHLPSVAFLLQQGADPNIRGEYGYGYAPLHLAEDEKVAAKLLEHGADVNIKTKMFDETPLMQSDILSKPKVVKLLLENGAKPAAKDFFKKTALDIAAGCNYESVSLLLKVGAKPTSVSLEKALQADEMDGFPKKSDQVNAVSALLKAGAKPKLNHLIDAAESGSIELAQLMLKHKVPLNKFGENDFQIEAKVSPLTRAVFYEESKMVKFLLSKGADPNLGKGKERPICVAIKSGSLSMVKLIVAAGATLDPFSKQLTLRAYADELGHKSIAAYLQKLELAGGQKHEKTTPPKKKSASSKKSAVKKKETVSKKSAVKKKSSVKKKAVVATGNSISASRRFEFSDGKSNKFWEIFQSGKKFTVCFGRVGTKGQAKTKEFTSKESCQKEADKLIAQKTSKGYEEM